MRGRGVAFYLFLIALSSTVAAAPDSRPNILLIILDTVRYDATSFGDPSGNNTPFLASLAASGVVFHNAYATHDFTPPSHFAMLTGIREGLGSEFDRAEYGAPFQLRLTGYDTFGVSANQLLLPSTMPALRGLSRFRGVQEIDQGTIPFAALADIDLRLRMFGCRITPRNRAMLYYSSDRILMEVVSQIRVAKRPWFGFVNLIDAHEPYAPDLKTYPPEKSLPANFDGDIMERKLGSELLNPESIEDPARREYVKRKIADVRSPKLVAVDLPPEHRAIYRRRYLAEVRALDARLRDFFELLRREKLFANTVVIIASDHGESFGEDDLITHMFSESGAIEVTHHVPLLIVTPASVRPTTRAVDRRVSIAAIAPTIYDLAGIDAAPLRERFTDSPRSLIPLFATMPPPSYKLTLPGAAEIDADAKKEMERRLRALGYLH